MAGWVRVLYIAAEGGEGMGAGAEVYPCTGWTSPADEIGDGDGRFEDTSLVRPAKMSSSSSTSSTLMAQSAPSLLGSCFAAARAA